ncbi:MAG: bifunctional protein-serine/threonine kinase/phosphatase [Verrucomicrobia bacterium]|nr:bifunctional protein-serine/threonine kinase/phosphatase [Verrucomicrobiota bacterium]
MRKKNEDSLGFWQPEEEPERLQRGAISVVADGLGGHENGDVASKMAVEIAIETFQRINPVNAPKQILKQIFDSANLAIYEAGMADPRGGRMATTLSVCIFRDKELFIGHVGDSRVYLVRQENLRRLTDDHSYTAMQVKLRLISEHEAKASRLRSMLTRTVGNEPIVHFDYKHLKLMSRDRIVQCTDGLYCYISDSDLCEGVDRLNMDEICPYLIALAERQKSDDNLSVQVVQIDRLVEPKHDQPISLLAKAGGGQTNSMSNEVQAGDLIDARFEIESVISRSGMASIYKAKDLQTGQTVAVKVPYMQLESDPAAFSRFQREAEIGELLDHPNIIKFIKVPNKSRQYIVTEYLEGRSLSTVLNEVRPLPISDAVQIASYVCAALAHMHEHKVVHRDLKPQNIMICNDGTLRIIDFGIAKSTEMRRLTFAGFTPAMGTPDYMAPEQVKGKRGDERTDIYSLGAVLYEMTTGSVPFEGPNPFIVMNSRLTGDPVAPRKLNPEISQALEEIILHAMEREPERRYQSALSMKKELDDPESVKITGRHDRLQSPKLWNTRWQGSRLIVLSAVVPILVFAGALFVTRCHGPVH